MNRRGRPIGHRLSAAMKQRISNSMRGHEVSTETRRAISIGVRRSKIGKPEKQAIRALYDEGQIPVCSIAAIYGISPKHVYKLMKEAVDGGV